MPFLTAKALEIDPDGMAFLSAVIRPDLERETAARPPERKTTPLAFQISPPQSDPSPIEVRCETQPVPVA